MGPCSIADPNSLVELIQLDARKPQFFICFDVLLGEDMIETLVLFGVSF